MKTDIQWQRTHPAFFQTLIENLPDGLIVIDADGIILSFNPAAERIFGYTRQEILQHNITELIPEPYTNEHKIQLENDDATGEKHLISNGREVLGKRKDGSTVLIYLSFSEMCIDEKRLFNGIVHELTLRKNTEQQIRKSEERFRATFEQAAVGIVHLTTDGRFLRVNQRFCRIVGYDQDELQKRHIKDITYDEDREIDARYARAILQDHRKTYSMEKRFCCKDGSLVWVNITVSLSRSTSGEPEYFIAVVEDITQRKLTERKLYINGERLKLALEASNDALWDWIIPDNRSYWSPRYYTMLGYAPDEFPADSESFAQLLHPDDRERILTRVAEAAYKGEVYQAEFRLRSKSGDWRWIFSRGKVVEWTQNSEPLRMIGTHVDITARKQAEEQLREYGDRLEELVEQRTQQLRESEERQRAQYKGVPVPTYTWQRKGDDFVLVDYNDAAEKITHGKIGQLLGTSANTLYSNQPEYIEDLRRCFLSGLAIEKDISYQLKTTGERKYFAVKYAFVPPEFILVHTDDITTRKQAEKALKESEARFRTLVDSMDDVVFTLDREQRHSGVFGHWAENHGLTPEFFLGKTSREILGPEAALPHEDANREALAGKNVVYEWSIRQPDGNMLYIQTSLSPIWDEQGRVVGLVGVGRDITERKRAAEALKKAKEEAEQANRAKSEFLANMSHELRTPLNAILGFAQIIQRDPSLPAKQQNNLRIISRSGEHLLQLINDVLEMSKIEAGRSTLQLMNFDLYALLTELEEVFSVRGREKKIGLCFKLDPQLPRFIRGDERKLRQILLNLLSNAVRFTEKGEVQLSASRELLMEQKKSNEKTCLVFAVKDTGPGIPAEEMNMLFEAFSQTASGRKSGAGSGLGLALSHQFARLLGGELRVESRKHHGSNFTLRICVKTVEENAVKKQPVSKRVIGLESEQTHYRILIVDDNLESREILRQLLQPIGFQIQEARNGQEALEQFARWHPDFIWMDMRMPLMDGYEATRRIRTQECENSEDSESCVPIIALTANAFEEQRMAVLEAGCNDLVSKPFYDAEIFEMLQKYLKLHYRYEENSSSTSEPQDGTNSTTVSLHQDLALLPPELLGALETAAERSNMHEMERLIEQIRIYNAELAHSLSLLADDFAYDEILELLQKRK